MERRVIKGFTDKNTKKAYPKGSKYVSEDKKRVNELVKSGNLSGEEAKVIEDKKTNDETDENENSLENKTMTELKQLSDDKGLEIVGTGKNGSIKKEDYIKALEA